MRDHDVLPVERGEVVRLIIAFAIFIFAIGAQAVDRDTCFNNAKGPFFDIFARMKVSPGEMAIRMNEACTELKDKEMVSSKSLTEHAFSAAGFIGGAMFGNAANSFSRLDETELQKSYQKELERIKQIEDPMERIKQVYDLAVRTQGKYDYETKGMDTAKSGMYVMTNLPGNLINNAEKRGTAGVCREFASLLQWSLMQVARHPSSKSSALGPKDFSSEMVGGMTPIGAHAWVRIHLPKHSSEGQLQGFQDFDVDSTWYSEFSPVYERRSGLSVKEQMAMVESCERVQKCLFVRQNRIDIQNTSGTGSSSAPSIKSGTNSPGIR